MRDTGSRSLSADTAILWRIARLLSGLSLAALACVLLAGYYWFFELFTHFRVQLLAVQALLLLACVLLRRPRWAATLLVALIVNALPIRGYLWPDRAGLADAAQSRSASAHPATIRVLSANVLASNRDARRLIELVRTLEPDVFAVLEITEAFAAALGELDAQYPFRMLIPEPGTFGIAVYSALPGTQFSAFELGGFAAIDAHIGAGDWHFVASHLLPPMSSSMAAQRNAQFVQLAEYLQRLEAGVVVAGDFNASVFSPQFADFVAVTGLRNAAAGFGPGFTWPTFFPALGIAIDHVLVSEEFGVTDYHRGGDIGSDHFPVVVDMIPREIGLD